MVVRQVPLAHLGGRVDGLVVACSIEINTLGHEIPMVHFQGQVSVLIPEVGLELLPHLDFFSDFVASSARLVRHPQHL